MSKYDTDLEFHHNSSHAKILDKILPDSYVLEFGPAHGVMTKYMQEKLQCKIYAVELDPIAANDAKQYCEKMLVGNIEEYTWKNEYAEIKFDYIIFADVLEHLYDPWRVLTEAKPLLNDKGKILLSLPNIANNAVIMDLISDKFEYRSTGLLDCTHLRFFTKPSIEKMVKECGYKPISIDATFFKPQFTEFKRSYLEFNLGVIKCLSEKPNGHVYQYIYELVDINNLSVRECQIEYLKEPLNIEIFYDTGKDFNQEESITILGQGKHSIDLPNFEIKRLRLDPNNSPGILKKAVIRVADCEGNIYDCKTQLVGFDYFFEQYAICYGSDPQIIIDAPIANPIKIIFELDYQEIYFVKDAINDLAFIEKMTELEPSK
ncbi:class I SAM-dependent methyltransferase [Legionella gresilensis]|uniref:class I SAM-dependent methyltransferase n=1 Tax=Legionella gresilensis TaxID=91823 RepID=UPI0010411164|nr:class I SAM-dependent methyltransferase [Legionella gresilensis]